MQKFVAFFFMIIGFSTLAYENISPEQAFEMHQKGEAIFIDVREKEEFDQGAIEGAHLYPLSQISQADVLSIQEKAEGKKIILYCRSGRRSAIAAEQYGFEGLSPLYNMMGGINSWPSE